MKPLVPAGLLLASLALVPTLAPAQAPAAAATASTSARTKNLNLLVVDAATQQPVVDAEVSMFGREPVKLLTDATGRVTFPIGLDQPMPEKDTRFALSVKSPRHESRQIEWFSDAGHARDTIPADYKVQLPTGGLAGGIVRDERGAPIAGAKIVVYASGLRSRPMGRGDKIQQEYGVYSSSPDDPLITDAEGRWRIEHFPTEVTQLSIDIIRPEGARTRFISGAMYRGPNERGGTVEPKELFAQSAVFTLKDGATVRGLVVDEAGHPVSGVQLRARDAASRNSPHTFMNLPDGTFALPHWDVRGVLVTAEKEGFQARSITISAEGDAGVGKIVLKSAKPLRLRVLGENDTPLADAEVQADVNPQPDQIVSWKTRTDADGRAEWPTAPDKPINIWIVPPKGSPYPFRSARLVGDGTEQVVRLRPGADKAVNVRIRVVDAATGNAVPKFEVWRRLANQPFHAWGEPADQGVFSREFKLTELPNGWVPSYRLQVRAAGYTGWASDALDFSFGDLDLTLEMNKGASTLADEPSSRGPGRGLDGERDPELLVLAGAVAHLLETGEIDAFVKATHGTLEDWKRLLPAGADPKDIPLGPDPARILTHRERSIRQSAQHVLALAGRAGLAPGKVRFSVKSISSPMNASTRMRVAGQEVSVPVAMGLRVVLAGEPVDPATAVVFRGDYELSIGNSRRLPSGWRTEEGVRWIALPASLGGEALRHELALTNRAAPATFSDQRTLSGMDDPALLRFGALVTDLVRQRDPQGFVAAARLTRDETADFYERTGRDVTPELDESYARISTGLAAAAQSMGALQERMGVDLHDAKLTVKQVLAERPRFMRFGQLDGVGVSSIRVAFAAESTRLAKSGRPLAGNYTVAIGSALRIGNRWVLVDDKIRFQDFPPGLVTDDELKHVELENYVAEHRTLPPGHPAPDVPFIKLGDNAPTSLSAYHGKIVVLEFWAVWCGPCQEPMEKLQQLVEAHPEWKDRVEVIALSIDDKAETARNHLEKKGWTKTFNVWAGEGAWRAPAPEAFRVRGVPTAYVLDREGRVVKAGHPASLNVASLVSEQLEKSAR